MNKVYFENEKEITKFAYSIGLGRYINQIIDECKINGYLKKDILQEAKENWENSYINFEENNIEAKKYIKLLEKRVEELEFNEES